MGAVAVTLKVMPESADTDFDLLKARVRDALAPSIRSLKVEPVAFGLMAILAVAVIDDASGGSEGLEAVLSAVPGVGSVETVDVTLV